MKKSLHLRIASRGKSGGDRKSSARVLAVAAMFGIPPLAAPSPLHAPFKLALHPGDILLITGPSGSGKSTLLRGIAQALAANRTLKVLSLGGAGQGAQMADAPPHNAALVDCFSRPLDETLRLLAMAGLSEARLLLRSPAELSEGERFRFRLARFLASDADVLIADEFAAPLDRLTARAVAWQLGKFIRASLRSGRPRTAIVATSHDDLAADLRPTVTIHTKFGEVCQIIRDQEVNIM